MDEHILCAAIHFDDGKKYVHQPKNIETGFVIAGRRHHNCFATIGALREANDKKHFELGEPTQGFITSKDRFVDRKEGYIIALAAAQTDYKENSKLFSEDLY